MIAARAYMATRHESLHMSANSNAGPHFCAGATLARMKLNLALTTLLSRFGYVQLADHGLAWKQGHLMFRGPSRLYVKIG